MKVALVIEGGREQITLTPETPTERAILDKMHEPNRRVMSIHKGGFYRCEGGWSRLDHANNDSTMLVLDAVGDA